MDKFYFEKIKFLLKLTEFKDDLVFMVIFYYIELSQKCNQSKIIVALCFFLGYFCCIPEVKKVDFKKIF